MKGLFESKPTPLLLPLSHRPYWSVFRLNTQIIPSSDSYKYMISFTRSPLLLQLLNPQFSVDYLMPYFSGSSFYSELTLLGIPMFTFIQKTNSTVCVFTRLLHHLKFRQQERKEKDPSYFKPSSPYEFFLPPRNLFSDRWC